MAISEEIAPTSGIAVGEVGGQEMVLVPVLTEEEAAASTLSRGKKMTPVLPPKGVNAHEFKQIMGVCYMLYMRERRLPEPHEVQNNLPSITGLNVAQVMASPQFRRGMLIRGIDFSPTSSLTPEQDMAMAIMATPTGTFDQRLRKAGVAPSKWRAWLRDPAFKSVWDSVGGQVLKDLENDMLTQLAARALEGDANAIKYALEVSGRHAPQRQQNVDATLVIAQMIEIVQEEVKDVEVLQRIAARMQMVAGTPAGHGVISDARQMMIEQGGG